MTIDYDKIFGDAEKAIKERDRQLKEMAKSAVEIGRIRNYDGGLSVTKFENKYYWSIDNFDGEDWNEIPDYLAKALLRYQSELDGGL